MKYEISSVEIEMALEALPESCDDCGQTHIPVWVHREELLRYARDGKEMDKLNAALMAVLAEFHHVDPVSIDKVVSYLSYELGFPPE